jgi:hypothetical protein
LLSDGRTGLDLLPGRVSTRNHQQSKCYRHILERINSPRERSYTKEIVVEPELIVRGTTMVEAAKAVHL